MVSSDRNVRLVEARSNSHLAEEWDKLAPQRNQMITSGRDLSYTHILLPSLTRLLDGIITDGQRVLDAGCGTGTFVKELARFHHTADFVGVDPSQASIEIASQHLNSFGNCSFRAVSVEALAADADMRSTFRVIIANMLLQNVASIDDVMKASSQLLTDDGVFVFAISHPCFWPRYWGYEKESWFKYDSELWIEAPFQTSLAAGADLRTTHVHRPLERYMDSFSNVGLHLDAMYEPTPGSRLKHFYPEAWEFPRFLVGRCRRQGS